jgi:hypothetical protein
MLNRHFAKKKGSSKQSSGTALAFLTNHFGWQLEAYFHMVEAAWTEEQHRRNPQTK